MGLDELVLAPAVLAKCYENALVDSGVEKPETPKSGIPSLGNNLQHILLVNFDPIHHIVSDPDLEFLTNILSACKLAIADISIVNAAGNTEVEYQNLNAHFSPRVILFAGSKPQDLGFPVQFPMFKIQRYDGKQYLSFPSLIELSKNKESKTQLWQQLKQLFAV